MFLLGIKISLQAKPRCSKSLNVSRARMTIKIDYEYPIGSATTMAEYITNVTFPNIRMGTGQEAQQQANADLNLSLTFFVLFFAAFNIALVLYDHSEDKSKTSDNNRYPFIVTG